MPTDTNEQLAYNYNAHSEMRKGDKVSYTGEGHRMLMADSSASRRVSVSKRSIHTIRSKKYVNGTPSCVSTLLWIFDETTKKELTRRQ